MHIVILTAAAILGLPSGPAQPAKSAPAISGNYLEVRTCDVYTGSCVANAQMNLEGKEAIVVWSVREGAWNGVALDGLNVIAIVRADTTLGDLRYHPAGGNAVLVVDAAATALQKAALAKFAEARAGGLIRKVVDVKVAHIQARIGACARNGCAIVKAGSLATITTRCLNDQDHLCGNEETFYPPLTRVSDPMVAFTEIASYQGTGLNLTFQATSQRSAFIGTFAN